MTIGRKSKSVYVMTFSAIMLLGTFSIALPSQNVFADHSGCVIDIEFKRGDTVVFTETQSDSTAVCRTGDGIVFDFNNRWTGLWNRCVETSTVNLSIDTDTGDQEVFDCSGPWSIVVTGNPDTVGGHGGINFNAIVTVLP